MANKTPEYTRRAVDNYRKQRDSITVLLPKGTKERIRAATGDSLNAYIVSVVLSDLETREKEHPEKDPG